MSSRPIERPPRRRWPGLVLRAIALLALLSLATTYSIIWFKSLGAPSARTLGLWLLTLSLSLVLVRARAYRLVVVNLLGLLAGVWAFEAYSALESRDDHPAPPTNSVGYYSMERGEVLGFGPARGFVNHSRLEREGRLIYDVTYRIDDQGLRVAPRADAEPEGTLFFFGDSFTFGEGLEDSEALPYLVGELTHGRYRVFNFAFQGYGPHQMLSAIEHGLVARIAPPDPSRGDVVVVYTAIPDHARRSAGLAFYDTHGPKYALDTGDEPRFAGHFDDDGYTVFLRKFFLYQRIASVRTDVDARDIELFGAIVAAAQRRLREAYGARFQVLFWDDPKDPHTPDVIGALERRGLATHRISGVLPGYPQSAPEYTLAGDGHPNARANAIIADYVLSRIVRPRPEQASAQRRAVPASSAAPR